MGLFGGIASAIGSVASTVLGNNSAKHEAESNRDWQEDMSNTSVQRRVADLKAAGLNPLLAVSSASSGASTPAGGQANLKHFDPATITTMMNGLASAKLTQAQAKAQEQENSIFDTKADALKLQNELMKKNILNADVERDLKMAQTDSERARILTEAYRRANIKASTDKINNEAMLLGITQDYYQNGSYDRDFLLRYPGFAEKMMSENSKNGWSVLGNIGSAVSSSTAKRHKQFDDWYSNWKKGFKHRVNLMRW